MANTVTLTQMVDGSRIFEHRVNITGDASGEETATVFLDYSANNGPSGGTAVIDKIQSNLEGFTAELLWDASANTQAFVLSENPAVHSFKHFGGLQNPKGTGFTGDILFTTIGLGSADKGTIIISGRYKQA